MTLINAEKFVERIQDCGTDETKRKVADALCFLVKTEAEFHPVEAIPIEWMREWGKTRGDLIGWMLHEWAEKVEEDDKG